jgi:hypothetical protein
MQRRCSPDFASVRPFLLVAVLPLFAQTFKWSLAGLTKEVVAITERAARLHTFRLGAREVAGLGRETRTVSVGFLLHVPLPNEPTAGGRTTNIGAGTCNLPRFDNTDRPADFL